MLFNVYINDINYLLQNVLTILFADDTTFLLKNKDLSTLEARLNYVIYKVQDWCSCNKLFLNVDKTKLMFFNKRNNREPRVYNGNKQIEVVNRFKYLGFHLDSRLKHKFHIEHLISKLRRMVVISKKLGNYMDLNSAKAFYYAMTYSHLCYGTLVWGGTIGTPGFNKLQSLQDKIVNNLFGELLGGNCGSYLYRNLKILKIADLYRFKVCATIYKCLNLNYLPLLYDIISKLQRTHLYRTRQRHNYRVPMPRNKAVELNLIYKSLKAWNETSLEIRNADSFQLFKNRYLEHVFSTY